MSVQTSYSLTQSAAYAGTLGDSGPKRILSGFNANSAEVAYGRVLQIDTAVANGNNPLPVKVLASSSGVVCGVSIHDHAHEPQTTGAPQYGLLNVLEKGACWMSCENTIKAESSVYARFAAGSASVLGLLRADADADTCMLMSGWRVLIGCTGAGIVLVEVDAQNAAAISPLGTQLVSIPVPSLAAVANAGVLARFTPGVAGRILSMAFQVTTPVTTAAKAATMTPAIAGTSTTGGAVALTSANATPAGANVAGSAISALNSFTAAQEITVVASAVTAFVEGAGVLLLTLGT